MDNNERDRKLEQWLDEALSEYNAAEPRFGLEQRVLNRVHGEEKARARRWSLWKWMPAFAAIAAAAIIGVAIGPMMHKSAPLQVSTRLEQQVSPQSAERVDRQDHDKLEAGPAKKALTKQEVSAGVRERSETRTVASTTGKYPANRELKDEGKASDSYVLEGVAPSAPASVPPPPPQPQISGRSYQSVIANQPSSRAEFSKDGSTAAQTVEVTSENGRMQTDLGAVRLDQEQIPLKPVPTFAPAVDAKTASAPTGIIGVESVTVAKETAAFKRVKNKKTEQERADKARAEDANVIDVFGMRLRTEIKQATAGPMQFPTPAPLSEQEKLVLAAAKKLKDAPVKQDAQGGTIPAIEIKEIEIKPLEGPKK